LEPAAAAVGLVAAAPDLAPVTADAATAVGAVFVLRVLVTETFVSGGRIGVVAFGVDVVGAVGVVLAVVRTGFAGADLGAGLAGARLVAAAFAVSRLAGWAGAAFAVARLAAGLAFAVARLASLAALAGAAFAVARLAGAAFAVARLAALAFAVARLAGAAFAVARLAGAALAGAALVRVPAARAAAFTFVADGLGADFADTRVVLEERFADVAARVRTPAMPSPPERCYRPREARKSPTIRSPVIISLPATPPESRGIAGVHQIAPSR
jgi:hypothetical protein